MLQREGATLWCRSLSLFFCDVYRLATISAILTMVIMAYGLD